MNADQDHRLGAFMTQPFATTVSASGVAELIFDNPPVNAFDSHAQFAIANEIEALGKNSDVRVIVIAARGKGFCAGIDVKEVAADGSKILDVNYGNYDTFAAVHLNPKPVIVAVHGYVLGGGIGICGAADIVVAATDATFGVPEVDRGGMGMGAHLQRMFPVQKVRHMYFTGEFIDAAEAYRLGAVEKVVEREELLESAREIAEKIAEKSPEMIRIAKRSLNGVEDGSLEDKYRWEQGFTFEAYLMADSQEARDAFVDKRDPNFKP
jgi:enoyl-CoA hydratase